MRITHLRAPNIGMPLWYSCPSSYVLPSLMTESARATTSGLL